jgi:uncharacterized protein YkwD
MGRKRTLWNRIMGFMLTLSLVIGVLSVWTPAAAKAASGLSLSGTAHVQNDGDVDATTAKVDGIETLVLGTRGQGKRVERITLNLTNNTGISGSLQYQVHIQDKGWTDWLSAGQAAGTAGQGKRLEGIRIRLTGALANFYDVRYSAHIESYGDKQGWVYNGALAGTTGEGKRLEEIRVQLVPKGSVSTTPTLSYRVHVQNQGWESTWASAGGLAGTTGQGRRLEGITITVNDNLYSGGIRYKTHIQDIGWESEWKTDGEMSGTQGLGKRLEAIKIELTGTLANIYDIYYRVHAQDYGWLGWAKNGEESGTSGGAKRLESIQIVLVRKGSSAPSDTYNGITSAKSSAFYKIVTPVNGVNYKDVYAQQVLDLVNQERAAYGLNPLTMDEKAVEAAKVRAKEITQVFSHTRPDNTSCFTALDDAGLYLGVQIWGEGENIAAGQSTAAGVMNSWMNSPGHRANILDDSYTGIGIACYYDANTPYKYYWVQLFIKK